MGYIKQADHLLSLRKEMGITQAELAKLFGFNKKAGAQFISNCERGISYIPPKRWAIFFKKNKRERDEFSLVATYFMIDMSNCWLKEFNRK